MSSSPSVMCREPDSPGSMSMPIGPHGWSACIAHWQRLLAGVLGGPGSPQHPPAGWLMFSPSGASHLDGLLAAVCGRYALERYCTASAGLISPVQALISQDLVPEP